MTDDEDPSREFTTHQETQSGRGSAPQPLKGAIGPQAAFGTEIPAFSGPGSDSTSPPAPAGKGPKPRAAKAGERQRAWRQAHREHIKAAAKAYRESHKAEERARSKAWAEAHPERMRELLKKWRAARTPEQHAQDLAYARSWQGAWRLAHRKQREKKAGT